MTGQPIRKQDAKWLEHIRVSTGSLGSMYPGATDVPGSVFNRLYARGLVEKFFPDNQAHKERVIITQGGLQVLAARKGAP